MVHNKHNEDEEGEEILPFSSPNLLDYYDEIERRFEEQKKKKGRATKEWKDSINELIVHVNKTTKHKIYPIQ